jgi:hypothetical protein
MAATIEEEDLFSELYGGEQQENTPTPTTTTTTEPHK